MSSFDPNNSEEDEWLTSLSSNSTGGGNKKKGGKKGKTKKISNRIGKEEIVEADKDELISIEGFDEDIVLELIERSEKSIERVEKENIEILNSLNVDESLMNFNFLNKSMLVKLAQNEIKNLDDFAGLTTDDLLGYYEDRHDKNSKVQGILEEFNLTKDEGDQLILEARKIWLDK